MKKLTFIFWGCISAIFISTQSFAETTMSQEGQYIFNSLGFYLGGVLDNLTAFDNTTGLLTFSGSLTNGSELTILRIRYYEENSIFLIYFYVLFFVWAKNTTTIIQLHSTTDILW